MKNNHLILNPIVSEKASFLLAKNKYIFYVSKFINKIVLKDFIKKKYKIDISKINILNVKGKSKKLRNIKGKLPDRKKAIVTIKEGQAIDEIKGLF